MKMTKFRKSCIPIIKIIQMRKENVHLHIKILGLILFNWEFIDKTSNKHGN